MILMYTAIAYCILIKAVWHIRLRWQRLFNKSISTYTGSSIKEMFNPNRNFICRADGEWHQIRGIIWDLRWVCFEGTTSYETRIKRQSKDSLCADIIDWRK